MKFGIITYRNSRNIGDDIQSYAAARLLPHIDYYIEREELDTFCPEDMTPVSVIMNGWFMYNKLAWPPSAWINPLYISMHFCDEDPLQIRDRFLKGIGSEDLLLHQPIGCRDEHTMKMLEKHGISTWFSGCLTMTLSANFPQKTRNTIYLTNVSPEIAQFCMKLYPNEKIELIDHEIKKFVENENEWNQRFENVEALLTKYQNAKAVITTKLHCALPCLALGTPVLLLTNDAIAEQERFSGLTRFVNHCSDNNFLSGDYHFDLSNPPNNSEEYIPYRNKLLDVVNQFVLESEKKQEQLLIRAEQFDRDWLRRAKWKNGILDELNSLAIRCWFEPTWLIELQKAKELSEQKAHSLEMETKRLETEAHEQENEISLLKIQVQDISDCLYQKELENKEILASRSWKLTKPLRFIKHLFAFRS